MKYRIHDHPIWVQGAERIVPSDGGTAFERMTPALLEFWSAPEGKRLRARSTSGVRLVLRTDSRRVAISICFAGTARPFHGLDVVVDGEAPRRVGPPDGEAQPWFGEVFVQEHRRLRSLEIWLPHASEVLLEALEVEDGALLEAGSRPGKVWIAIGDSITQGMLASSPTRTYAAVAARAAGLGLHNLGVGGETMQEEVGRLCRPIRGDLATVAFGINDYNQGMSLGEYARRARALLDGLLEGRPRFPVAMITATPCLRESRPETVAAPLEEYRRVAREVVARYPSVRVLEGTELIPADENLFADGIHPNDAGMATYGKALAPHLREMLACVA